MAKFHGQVISRGRIRGPLTARIYHHYLWGYANAEVFRQQPATIPQLKAIVEEVAVNLSSKVLRAIMANFGKRCEVFLEFDTVILNTRKSDFNEF